MKKKLTPILALLLAALSLFFAAPEDARVENAYPSEAVYTTEMPAASSAETQAWIDPYGSYTSKEDVALYIHTYGSAYSLPSPRHRELERQFHHFCQQHGILHDNDVIFQYLSQYQEQNQQLTLF